MTVPAFGWSATETDVFVADWPSAVIAVAVSGIFACAGWLFVFRAERVQAEQLRWLRVNGVPEQDWRTRYVAHQLYPTQLRLFGGILLLCIGGIVLALAVNLLIAALGDS